ncbi:uncharacterized protein N7482_010505 [Penicillium canariense]|uniref:Rhodopsin domain-containing protein n=1 Tax=Penicillium canariense TaxID=189055 RepID=A0A9W9LED4_9EURO|nr:uncharacterized protein N7482_010505 [Penicillium canariense]KAJ5151253.1 hypothetical protein N7482_010505 [Penicillium canariense]
MFLVGGRNTGIFVGVTVTVILASIFVALRLVNRFAISKHSGWDDYSIIVAWILAFGLSFTVDFAVSKGLGLHKDRIPATGIHQLLVARYVAIVLFNPALMMTKVSILLLYLTIARRPHNFLRIGSYITLAVVVVGGLVLTFITAFQCRPVQAVYDINIKNPSCIPIEDIYLASVPVSLATDLAILVLPLPLLASLALRRWEKTILLLTFVLGVVFIIVVDVTRIYYLQLAAASLRELANAKVPVSLDFLYNAGLVLLWSAVEVNVAIVGACIPTLRPLVKLLIAKMKMVLSYSHGSSEGELIRSPSSPSTLDGFGPPSLNERLRHSMRSEAPLVDNQQQHHPYQMSMRSSHTLSDPEAARRPSRRTETSARWRFSHTEPPKCMLDMEGTESVKYCAIVTLILFVEGFIVTMLFSVNGKMVVVTSQQQGIGISSATYGGGAIGCFLAYGLLRRLGFRPTFVTGFAIISVGTLVFWPSGALSSYTGFIVSNVLVGMGIPLLELTGIAFIVLCGPPKYVEIRLLFALSISYIGSTVSLVLAQKVFFKNVADAHSLIVIQWAYLTIALITTLLSLLVYYTPLPEATASELRSRERRLWIDPSQKLYGRVPVLHSTLALAVLSSFCSAGALTCLRTFVGTLLKSISTGSGAGTSTNLGPLDLNIVLTAIYAGAHMIAAFLACLIPPRILLLWAYACGIVFSTLIMQLYFSSAETTEYLVIFFAIVLGPIPSLCLAVALPGMGAHTKIATTLMECSANLAACVTVWIMFAVTHAPSHSVQYSFCVLVALYAAGAVFPLYVTLVPSSLPYNRPPALRAVWKRFRRQ